MKATSGHITFYKAKCLERIHSKLVNDGNILSIGEVDELLKVHAGYSFDDSTKDMTREELNTLIEWSKQFAQSIGLDLDENNEIKFKW